MFAQLQEFARQEKSKHNSPYCLNKRFCNFANEDSLICKKGCGGGILSVDMKEKKRPAETGSG